MARADLSALLGKLPAEQPTAVSSSTETAISDVVPAVAEARPATPRRADPKTLPAESGYLGFVRKDTRLRADQLEALTVQARRLNRAKRNTGVRITENTLIRVAVDLLLGRVEMAAGDDEAGLLGSVW